MFFETLLTCVFKGEWLALLPFQQDDLIRESAPLLFKKYEGYLRCEHKTKEAATRAITGEYKRLKRRHSSND